ncbi:MAG: tetratricopeptide repeat protein [Pseudomonas sp.]|uniref:tetratricopeptide repeat protein n=1 Tax=Pseudomonas sp. TaxID=306 RepID=UPI002733139C|nr:tetratricopeptide repeat protein [Pseudomonas sp.]MDP3845631.1 tetratricopeptide repeat protein [Pseudomonas sp.]
MRKVFLGGLALLFSGALQAAATDDYLAGLKALDKNQLSEAKYLLEQAAIAGMPEAQFRLGELLPGQDGERWLRAAVRQGSIVAANSLAQRYYDDTRYRRAAQCWLFSAKQGNSQAQSRLGALQVIGYGLPKDPVQAYAWLNLAASAGDADVVELRDTLIEQLGKDRQMAGEALSRDLLEHPPTLPGEPPCGE